MSYFYFSRRYGQENQAELSLDCLHIHEVFFFKLEEPWYLSGLETAIFPTINEVPLHSFSLSPNLRPDLTEILVKRT